MISERTGQNEEIVSTFLGTKFEEIEKLLNETSSANVDGLGVFRVMKTASRNKILFIPGFEALDEIKQNICLANLEGSTTSTSTLSDDFENIENTAEQAEATNEGGADFEIDALKEQITNSNKVEKETSFKDNKTENSDPYSTNTWDDFYSKSKKKHNWGTTILLIVAAALIGIIVATLV